VKPTMISDPPTHPKIAIMRFTSITLSKGLQGDFINWTTKFKEENYKFWKVSFNQCHNHIATEKWKNKWQNNSTLLLYKKTRQIYKFT